jgi:hypothetical protein
MSKIEVDAITQQSGSTLTVGGGACKTATVDATTVTLGRSGGTVSLAAGATQSGFGRTGTVDWQTGSIKTATFTAANGEGYFANTSGGAFTMNLPAGSAGNIVSVVDYTNSFQTHALTISPNGSQKIGGVADPVNLVTEGQSVTFVYVDDTEGWKNVQDSTSNVIGGTFITATGGNTVTTCGNCKIHTFTGPGTFTVSAISSCAANNQVSYLVVGGAGGGGDSETGQGHPGGGGGAGGFREDKSPITPYTASPLEGAGPITVTATGFPITVGAGGAAGTACFQRGGCGNNSVFSTITAALGGGGGAGSNAGPNRNGQAGGSGGGSASSNQPSFAGGAGNTPPVSPPQGNAGGPGAGCGAGRAGGGGGATAAGTQTPGSGTHPGGAGAATGITASSVTYSAGGVVLGSTGTGPAGGANTGDGGAGGLNNDGGAGGSGIVVIRYKFQ